MAAADLRARILAELDRREQAARSMPAGQWSVKILHRNVDGDRAQAEVRDADGDLLAEVAVIEDAEHIALHDPADALRRYAAARRVLNRHQPEHWRSDEDRTDGGPVTCKHCGWDEEAYPGELGETDYPCHELLDLADSLGIGGTDG